MHFVIADDHPIFRGGLISLLTADFSDVVIKEFSDGSTVEEYILSYSPEIAILDIDMPEKNGLEVCLNISEKVKTRVIILTMYNDAEMLRKAKTNGAWGYLVKDNTSDELSECIKTILSGERYIAKSLRDSKLLQEIERKHEKIHEKLSSLSQTELKTLKLVSQKFSSKEIAELLFVSTKSVENYRSRICKKLMLDARNNSLLLWVLDHKELIEEYREEK
jgi:DNA-binding NarL/FixJ family response regulator